MPTVPPPPPLPISTSSRHFTRIANSNDVPLKVCLWAMEDLEVQKACFYSKICTSTSPKECVYLKVKPILQVGPTCGLVAIAMIMQGRPTAGDCMKQAQELHYTNNGEMFSAKWLLDILNRKIPSSLVCCLHPEKLRSYLYSGDLNTEFIKEKLKIHCLILVPYDADRNHSPCLKNGHSAHWALLVGYLIDENNDVSKYNCFILLQLLQFSVQCGSKCFKFNLFIKCNFVYYFFLYLSKVLCFCAPWENKKYGIVFIKQIE